MNFPPPPLPAPPRLCRDCGVDPGQPHEGGCDVARCLWTGEQRIQCAGWMTAEICKVLHEADRGGLADGLALYLGLDDPDHDCGHDIWTGEYPGLDDARRHGLWTRWREKGGWERCAPDHPDARPSLNDLVMLCEWDRTTGRWELRQPREDKR